MKELNVDILHEELLKKKPLLAFSPENDYSSWKKEVRKTFLNLLGMNEIERNICDLNIEVEEELDHEDYTRIRYTFESEKGITVPCYLLIPKKKKGPYPVCITLQGHTTGFHISIGEKRYPKDDLALQNKQFAIEAVKNGFAALCIELRGTGELTTPLRSRGRTPTSACYHTAMTALLLGRTLIGERVWDIHRGIDSLAHFGDQLNLENIVIFGMSCGGTAAYYSACYDERIKVVVSACSICSYKDSIANTYHCACNFIPDIAKYFDMGELATLIAPRRLVIGAGELDPAFPLEGTKEVYSVIEQIYEKENVPHRTKLIVYKDRPHNLDTELTFETIKKMYRDCFLPAVCYKLSI